MRKGHARRLALILVGASAVLAAGCARNKDLDALNRRQAATIVSLNNEIARLNDELDAMAQSKEDLARAKSELEQKFRDELAGGDVKLAMTERGVVLTVLDRVLFDSGRAEIKTSAQDTLQKIAETLERTARGNRIYVEGHTDTDPIRVSGWKSNWELSTSRATEVIHYFEDLGMDPAQLAASGYGEFNPVAENATPDGKQENRRVEIVITPKKLEPRPQSAGLAAQPAPIQPASAQASDAFTK